MQIRELSARKILDSRKELTIEVSVNGCKASAPSGKSKGKHETPSYHNSLDWNINAINSLAQSLNSLNFNSFQDLSKVESIVKTKFKLLNAKQFGANALFALESSILKALAKSQNKELWQIINPHARKMPIPLGNAIGGGVHSHSKEHPTFQEFLLIPKGKTFKENVKIMQSVRKQLGNLLKSNKMNDEGAWETSFSELEILNLLKQFKDKVNVGLDVASSSFYENGQYYYSNKVLDREAQLSFINFLIEEYNLLYIEDPLQEEDFKGFSKINRSKMHLICGDDLTTTSLSRLKKAIKSKSINAMIIKPNQNGSLIETKKVVELCKKHNIKTILSHRSGETLDTTIADLAFAFQTDFIKTGIATKYRECKLKRLIEIEISIK